MIDPESTLWIIEMFDPDKGQWVPTVAASLSFREVRAELRDWRQMNPDDKLRIRKYVRQADES